ncbi:MAG: hypothetical protein AB7O57_12285 [Hyphomicrobiaceae bacterium]
MAIRMTKAWVPLTPEIVKKLPGQLGVFQLADAKGDVVFIGFAGGRSLFGVRSEIEKAMADPSISASQFRVEINQQYTTRYQELLMLHVHDHGSVPTGNVGKPLPTLGRLSPL